MPCCVAVRSSTPKLRKSLLCYSATVRSRGGVLSREGPFSEVPLYIFPGQCHTVISNLAITPIILNPFYNAAGIRCVQRANNALHSSSMFCDDTPVITGDKWGVQKTINYCSLSLSQHTHSSLALSQKNIGYWRAERANLVVQCARFFYYHLHVLSRAMPYRNF